MFNMWWAQAGWLNSKSRQQNVTLINLTKNDVKTLSLAFSTNSYSRCYVSNQLQDDKYQVANLPKARISILPLEQKCNITCLGAHLPEDFNIIKVKGKNYSNYYAKLQGLWFDCQLKSSGFMLFDMLLWTSYNSDTAFITEFIA